MIPFISSEVKTDADKILRYQSLVAVGFMMSEDHDYRDRIISLYPDFIPFICNLSRNECDLKCIEILTWVISVISGMSMKHQKFALSAENP